ncbi:Uncharacterised protein [Enterobacter cloacae]|nr:Uncharacterised protein [Enterobacter cloacae]
MEINGTAMRLPIKSSGFVMLFFTTSASEFPSCDASRKTSIGTCWLAATASGLEPRLPICTSPEANARTIAAPLSNLRQSTFAPLALAKVLSACATFAGSAEV